jgi:hypothetical protein
MNATGDSEENPELQISATPDLPLSAPVAAGLLQTRELGVYFREPDDSAPARRGAPLPPVPAQPAALPHRPAGRAPGTARPPAHAARAPRPPAHAAPAGPPAENGSPAGRPAEPVHPAGRAAENGSTDTWAENGTHADMPAENGSPAAMPGYADPAGTPRGNAAPAAASRAHLAPVGEPGGHDPGARPAPRAESVMADWSSDDPPEDPNRVLIRKHLDAVRVSAANASSWLETSGHYARLVNRDGVVPVTARLSRDDIDFLGRAREQVLGFAELGLRLLELHAPLDAGGISTDPSSPILRCRSCMWRWPCPTFRMLSDALSELPSPGAPPAR